MTKKIFLFLLGLCIGCRVAYADVSLSINGLDGALADNVNAYVSSIPKSDYSTSLRFQSRLTKSITQALQALGYYHAKISYSIAKSNDEIKVYITPGEPIIVDTMDVVIEGEAKDDRAFKRVLRQSPLKQGQVLNQGDYDSLKSSIRNLALARGYFDGEFSLTRLEVIPATNKANVRLHFNSGIRYHFGTTEILGSQIWLDRVESLRPFKDNSPYSLNKMGEYNQNLSNTDWFSSVLVEPDLTQLGKGRELPIKVSLAPAARNQLETGIGYSTDVGVRGTLKWKKPWVSARGHSFSTSMSLSQPEQNVTASYKIPLQDVLHDYYELQFGLKRVNNRDTQSFESNLSASRHWLNDNGWHTSVYVRHLYENYSQGLQEDGVHFLLPGVSLLRTRTRGGAMPLWGDKQSLTLEYGDPALLSATRVVRILGHSAWIRSIGRNHRGIIRLDGGANLTSDVDKLSPSLRFFAGGDNSIRGYGYESISPEDSSGALTGAKYLLTSTAEYQYRLYKNWWGAVFYDTGDAFNTTPDWKSGAGVGIRWASPVGPIRLDVAWGLDSQPKNQIRLHFSLGPEL